MIVYLQDLVHNQASHICICSENDLHDIGHVHCSLQNN